METTDISGALRKKLPKENKLERWYRERKRTNIVFRELTELEADCVNMAGGLRRQ